MPCPYCGAPMPVSGNNRPRTKHCGDGPCARSWQAERMREFQARYLAEHGVRYEDRYKVEQICVDCGGTFRTRPSHGAERCLKCQRQKAWRESGARASAEANRARAAERAIRRKTLVLAGPVQPMERLRFRQAAERLERATLGTRSKNAIWVGATCVRCEARFVCMLTHDFPRYCSRSCLRSDAKTRRRARKYGSHHVIYRRRAIFERDRWVCQLCGKRTKRTAKVPDPKAPVIDHIVPLAAGAENGGVDAPWNVQCAHFLCNSFKSDNCAQPALALEVA